MFCENKQKLNFSLTIKIDRKIFFEKSYRFSDTEEKSIDTLVLMSFCLKWNIKSNVLMPGLKSLLIDTRNIHYAKMMEAEFLSPSFCLVMSAESTNDLSLI